MDKTKNIIAQLKILLPFHSGKRDRDIQMQSFLGYSKILQLKMINSIRLSWSGLSHQISDDGKYMRKKTFETA